MRVKKNRWLSVATAFAIAFAIASAAPLFAASSKSAKISPELKTLLNRLQKHYQETSSFTANFKEVISPTGGTRRELEGTVYYRKPGKMRWEFGGADQELIVSDGKELYTYQPDLNQVLKTPVEQAFRSSAAAAFLLGIGNVERDFDAVVPANPPPDNLKHVVLKPKNGGDTIEMGLDPALDLRKLRITDQLGDVTDLAFSDIKTGVALDDKLFTFSPPPNADIVEAPQPPKQDFR
jgi:outer membrane lipoprotein carrier protein